MSRAAAQLVTLAALSVSCAAPPSPPPREAAPIAQEAPLPAGLEPAQGAARLATWKARTQGLIALTDWSCPVGEQEPGFELTTPAEFLKAPREGRFIMSGYIAPNYFAEQGEDAWLFTSAKLDLKSKDQDVLLYHSLYCTKVFQGSRPWTLCGEEKYCDSRERHSCCPFLMGYKVFVEDQWRCYGDCINLGDTTCSSYRAYNYMDQAIRGTLPKAHHIYNCSRKIKPPCDKLPDRCRVEKGMYRLRGVTRYVGAKEIDGYKVNMWRFDVIRPAL